MPALAWGLPFLGVLLSTAVVPMVAPRFWHRRMGGVCAIWTLALGVADGIAHGIDATVAEVWRSLLVEFLPFVTLLLALYTTAGGILIRGGPGGTPLGNTAILALGAVMAGMMGTTGAAMVLIHPFLRANTHRTRKRHLAIFFTLIVANAGGATSPLGDPPLYVGFLHGVPFAWPLVNLIEPLLLLVWPLLLIFFLLDRRLARRDIRPPPVRMTLRGRGNVVLVLLAVLTVLAQGVWHPGDAVVFGQAIGQERLIGIAIFLAISVLSGVATPRAVHAGNMFTWAPMAEIAKLFAAIFITIAPVMAMLAAGLDGPLAPLLRLAQRADGSPSPAVYFWLTGILSAFLDNAPTYLVFFHLAGGDPVRLTGPLHQTLQAISAGAVFFGGGTYIGNAPNLLVRAIASHRGVRMPGFFGYCAWSAPLLLPLLVLMTFVFFAGGSP